MNHKPTHISSKGQEAPKLSSDNNGQPQKHQILKASIQLCHDHLVGPRMGRRKEVQSTELINHVSGALFMSFHLC